MAHYNDIGISRELDWPRIRKLLKIGMVAAVLVLIGDMMLGYGVSDAAQTGLARRMSMYMHLSDTGLFFSAFLGLIGIPLEGLCYFGIYRLIRDEHLAHGFRSGILGILIFGGCGVHVPCLSTVFVYRHLLQAAPETAVQTTMRFATYFLLPGTVLFLIFYVVLCVFQIRAFRTGNTPYPRWCWVFCLPVGMAAVMLLKLFPETALRNALTAGWISIGNFWMCGGLLAMSGKAERKAA
ncbi:MAG: hypothetical protein IJ708_02970 [Clostridia bacterium]|nr:hypothetical protein [Clostridia bacterium]